MTFGEFIKDKRLAADLSLRDFCGRAGLDPSNWSKVERGKLPPTDDREKLEVLASIISLKRGSADWHQFFDLAAIARGEIPAEVYSDERVLAALPVFFRTARGEKPTREELDEVIRLLRRR